MSADRGEGPVALSPDGEPRAAGGVGGATGDAEDGTKKRLPIVLSLASCSGARCCPRHPSVPRSWGLPAFSDRLVDTPVFARYLATTGLSPYAPNSAGRASGQCPCEARRFTKVVRNGRLSGGRILNFFDQHPPSPQTVSLKYPDCPITNGLSPYLFVLKTKSLNFETPLLGSTGSNPGHLLSDVHVEATERIIPSL